jgi:hypothetical protein
MCAVSPVNKARAAVNAALHTDIVRKVENIEAFFVKKSPAIMSTSILLHAKRARRVDHNISSGGSNTSAASTALIDSAIEPSLHDANEAFSLCDISLSAGVRASAETLRRFLSSVNGSPPK